MEKFCCFTGPRLYKLPNEIVNNENLLNILKSKIKTEILNAVNEGITVFLSGMAIGIDTICAEIVLELKKSLPKIKLYCVIPFIGQASKWSKDNIAKYEYILSKADKTIVLAKEYQRGCYFKRNEYMVNLSSKLIAVYTGQGGGTKYTINYAQKKGIDIRIIHI